LCDVVQSYANDRVGTRILRPLAQLHSAHDLREHANAAE
jgi:hypothetical protein